MFDSYWQEKKLYDEKIRNNTHYVTPDPANSPIFNHSILFKTIEDRDNMTDAELRYFIHMNFMVILTNIFDTSVRALYTAAFRDNRFLDALIDVLYKIQYFEPDIVTRLNLIAYHYVTQKEEFIDKTTLAKMISISKIINAQKAIRLKQFHLPEFVENYLLLSRYSDFNLEVCVKRVNFMLISSPSVIDFFGLDEIYDASENVIDLLSKLLMELYRIEDWPLVLPYYMTDVLPSNDSESTWVTSEVESMDSNMSLAVLKVLDQLIPDSKTLRGILLSYAESYRLLDYKKPVKFSFNSISNEYKRLTSVIHYLSEEEHIYLP